MATDIIDRRLQSVIESLGLGELAETIRREHEECLLAAISSLGHAIRAGEALLVARDRVPRGQWESWLDENCPNVRVMSRQYMRLATYRDMIPVEISTAIEAQRALKGLPAFDGSGPARHDESVRAQALELVAQDVPKTVIARMLGVDRKCIRRWMNGRDQPARQGSYRMGRPSRADQKRHQQIVARSQAKHAIGPLALANNFRAVAEAHRGDQRGTLIEALRGLSETALGWAEQLERADRDVA